MDTIASPKSVSKNIANLQTRLQHLQQQEKRLIEQRRELLTGPQDPKTQQVLTQVETELLVVLHGKETAESRLRLWKSCCPT